MTKAETPAAIDFDVDTSPSKEVVVDSLIRDISVDACILDLIDNSIDAARENIGTLVSREIRQISERHFDRYEVNIKISGEEFQITDNCGGITSNHLKNSVLRFGQRSQHESGIGVFGVGLNRAIFKLGKSIELNSDTGLERCSLSLDTEKYIKSDNWLLPAQKHQTQGKIGTTISIRKIPTEISATLSDQDWLDSLQMEIGLRYGKIIKSGLTIKINDTAVDGRTIEIRENSPFEKIEKRFNISEGLTVHIEAGQHEKHRFSAEEGQRKPHPKELTKEFGWTIYCNDRAVIVSDKSWKTGWGVKFHNQFYGFVGNVYFKCADPEKLPWSTTKTDVDLNNEAYRLTLEQMKSFTKKWREFSEYLKNLDGPLPIIPRTPKNPVVEQPIPAHPLQPKPTTSTPKEQDKKTQKEQKKIDKKIDHNTFTTILPQDINELHCYDKLLALVHEGKKLELSRLSYTGMVLIRMLFEVSASCFIKRRNIYKQAKAFTLSQRNQERQKQGKPSLTEKEETELSLSIDEFISFFEAHDIVWEDSTRKHAKQSLKKFGKHKERLNSAAHNHFQTIHNTEAFQIRDEVLPILRHLIESN